MIMYKTILAFVVMCISLMLSACGASNLPTQPQSQPTNTASKPAVRNDPWRLYSINGQVVIQSQITLMLEEGGRVRGFAGCNKYFGALNSFVNGRVSFKSIGRTKRLCSDQNINQIETDFVRALESSTNYQMTATQLSMSSASNKLVFLKKSNR